MNAKKTDTVATLPPAPKPGRSYSLRIRMATPEVSDVLDQFIASARWGQQNYKLGELIELGLKAKGLVK
jgi:hypothetical protein